VNQADMGTQIVVAGAGYSGLHVAQRLGRWLSRRSNARLTLIDQHHYHELVTELPRVATGTREEEATHIGLEAVLPDQVNFMQTAVTEIRPAKRLVETASGDVKYSHLVLALGSTPNDFQIPGLSERALYPYTSDGARGVWEAVNLSVRRAAEASDPDERQRLMTLVVGGGGPTGVEIAAGFAEELPELASRYGVPPDLCRTVLIEAGESILPGASPALVQRASEILQELHVAVRTGAVIVGATEEGLTVRGGELVRGGVFVWAGGVKGPQILSRSGLPTGTNGRLEVDRYLRVLDHPEIFAAGDAALVIDPDTGRVLAPLAQTALEEAANVAHNLPAAVEGKPLRPFRFHDKGFVVSVGSNKGVAAVAGLTIGGRLAHALKEAIEWEYRQSVKHLRGWGAA
jgi:NADH:ubiquinone reductase (H+-translocating)